MSLVQGICNFALNLELNSFLTPNFGTKITFGIQTVTVLTLKNASQKTDSTWTVIDASNPFILGIRDTESVQNFQEKLSGSRRIAVVGNGGIATEMVHELKGVDIVWAIKVLLI